MATDAVDRTWPDPQRRLGQTELARLCSLSSADLDALVEYGTLIPLTGQAAATRLFSAGWLAPLREVARLRSWYGLDLSTVSLLLGYLHRIAQLEHQARQLNAHLPHPQQLPREGPTPWREPHA